MSESSSLGFSLSRREVMGGALGGGLAAWVAGSTCLADSPSTGAAGRKFQAGAAMSDITPPLGCSMAGYLQDRSAVRIHDPLHVRSLVLDDGRTRLVLAVCDLIAIRKQEVDKARQLIQQHTGIPPANILISAIHTHTAPTPATVFQSDPDQNYLDWVAVRIADAVRCAVKNLAPARIGWAVGSEPSMVFNRRYFMKPGTIPPGPFEGMSNQVMMNPGQENPNIERPAGPIDPDIGLISVQHADGQPLAVYGTYALHYVGGEVPNEISADYFAMWAEAIGRMLGVPSTEPAEGRPPFVAMLANACSGNINNIDVRKVSAQKPPYSRMREVAEVVAASAFKALKEIRYRDWVGLAAAERTLELAVRKPSTAEVVRAKEIMAKARMPLVTLPDLYARETVLLADWPDKRTTVVQAMRIGDCGLATFPGEAFVELGLAVKEKSPFKPTICTALANDYAGYIPTSEAHKLGGYETWRARSSFLEESAAQRMVATALELLGALT